MLIFSNNLKQIYRRLLPDSVERFNFKNPQLFGISFVHHRPAKLRSILAIWTMTKFVCLTALMCWCYKSDDAGTKLRRWRGLVTWTCVYPNDFSMCLGRRCFVKPQDIQRDFGWSWIWANSGLVFDGFLYCVVFTEIIGFSSNQIPHIHPTEIDQQLGLKIIGL